MEKEFNIYIYDLKPEVQKKLIEFLGGENGNYDMFPLATLVNEDCEENE